MLNRSNKRFGEGSYTEDLMGHISISPKEIRIVMRAMQWAVMASHGKDKVPDSWQCKHISKNNFYIGEDMGEALNSFYYESIAGDIEY